MTAPKQSAGHRVLKLCLVPTPAAAAVTGLVAHNVTPDTRIGAEVVRDLGKGTTTFAAGELKRKGCPRFVEPLKVPGGAAVLCCAVRHRFGLAVVSLRRRTRRQRRLGARTPCHGQAAGVLGLTATWRDVPAGLPQAWPRPPPTARSPSSSWTTTASCRCCMSR